MNVIKFPYDVSWRVYSRRPRKSKNGAPDERAAEVAAVTARDESERQAIARLLADLSPMAYEIALEKIRKVMEDKP
jgi:hypothetical protein